MNSVAAKNARSVRKDFVPVDDYISKEFVELEKEKLWPKTWLIACRVEELERPGDYVVFDIADESIIILKAAPGKLKAYYNVCQHRGRRLFDPGCGNTKKFIYCRYHGWRYNLDGTVNHILNRNDWDECPEFSEEELRLKEVRMETWAGWVWVSMDPNIEPLRQYLAPIPDLLDPFEYEKCRVAWHHAIPLACNWKVIVDAFNEAYHSPATHPGTFPHWWPASTSKAYGRHGAFYVGEFLQPNTNPLYKSDRHPPIRERMHNWVYNFHDNAHSIMTKYATRAADRLMELAEDTPDEEVLAKFAEYHREEFEKAGTDWPSGLTPEVLGRTASDWHIFPNCITVPTPDGILWHRMRPNGDDPASSIWDVWTLCRVPAGEEPSKPEEVVFKNLADYKGRNPFLEEDISNMEAVQKGMKSRGFSGMRTNPVQERVVSNFHKHIYEYLSK